MTIDFGRIIRRSLKICWGNRWMAVLGAPTGSGGTGFIIGELVVEVAGLLAMAVGAALTGVGLGAIVAVAVAVLGGLAVVGAAISVAAVATGAVVWAGLELDSGLPVRWREAWRQGRRRGRRFVGILLLQVVSYAGPLGLLVGGMIGFLALRAPSGSTFAGGGGLVVFLLLAFVGEVVALALILSCQLLFGWAPALAVVRDLGPIGAYRESWRLFFRHKLDSFLLFLLAVFGTQFLSVAVFLATLAAAMPGLVLVGVGLATEAVAVTVSGAVVAGLGAVAALLLLGGFLGAVQQVMYALACRDLLQADRVIAGGAIASPAPASHSRFDAGLPPARVPA